MLLKLGTVFFLLDYYVVGLKNIFMKHNVGS